MNARLVQSSGSLSRTLKQVQVWTTPLGRRSGSSGHGRTRTRAAQDAKATLKRAEAFSEELAGQLASLSAMFALVATEPPESER